MLLQLLSLMKLLYAFALCGLAAAAQLPIGFERLSPESSPAFIGEDTFTTLSHPDPTNHVSVRIKKTNGWCDPDVRSYTGYIDAGPRHRESFVGEGGEADGLVQSSSTTLMRGKLPLRALWYCGPTAGVRGFRSRCLSRTLTLCGHSGLLVFDGSVHGARTLHDAAGWELYGAEPLLVRPAGWGGES